MTEICGCCSAVIQLKFPRQWCQPQEKALLKIVSHSKTKPSYFKHFKRGFKIFKCCDLKNIYIFCSELENCILCIWRAQSRLMVKEKWCQFLVWSQFCWFDHTDVTLTRAGFSPGGSRNVRYAPLLSSPEGWEACPTDAHLVGTNALH